MPKEHGWHGRFVPLLEDKQSNDLLRLVNSGVSYAKAGEVFGLTRGQVKRHIWYRRKMYEERARVRRPWTRDELTTARTLRKQGVPYPQIGQLLGRTKNSVCGTLWRLDQRGKRRTTTD